MCVNGDIEIIDCQPLIDELNTCLDGPPPDPPRDLLIQGSSWKYESCGIEVQGGGDDPPECTPEVQQQTKCIHDCILMTSCEVIKGEASQEEMDEYVECVSGLPIETATAGSTRRPPSQRRHELPTKLHRRRAVVRGRARSRRAQDLGHAGRVHAEALGVLERVAAHVRDHAIALVVDLVEERAARGDVVDGGGERVDVGARIELDGIEHLLRRDVAGGARDEAAAGLGGTRIARTMPKSMTTEASGGVRAGSRCVAGSNFSPPASGRRSQMFAGLMSRWTRPAPCSAARPAHDSSTTWRSSKSDIGALWNTA